jgi:hypothetical protein
LGSAIDELNLDEGRRARQTPAEEASEQGVEPEQLVYHFASGSRPCEASRPTNTSAMPAHERPDAQIRPSIFGKDR